MPCRAHMGRRRSRRAQPSTRSTSRVRQDLCDAVIWRTRMFAQFASIYDSDGLALSGGEIGKALGRRSYLRIPRSELLVPKREDGLDTQTGIT